MDFRKAMAASVVLHGALLVATLLSFGTTKPMVTMPSIEHIPIDLAEVSEEAQMQGERDGQRQETPQRREVANPVPRAEPVPTPPERERPVDPSSAPTPPPPPAAAPEPPPPPQRAEPTPTPPVPTPPARPQPPQQVAEQPPPDNEGLQRRIEEERRREQQEQQRQAAEQRRQEQAEQRRQQQEEQRRQQAEERRRQQEEQRRQQAEERRRQQQEAAAQRRREQQEQQRQQAFDAQQMRDLINRQQGQTPREGVRGNTERTASLGNPQGTGRRLTQSQTAMLVGMIRDQIQPCWSPPPGAQTARGINIRIEIFTNRDGSLNGRPRVMNSSADPLFRPTADSAVRALMRCSPLRLPADLYDARGGWREIEFSFDPSQFS